MHAYWCKIPLLADEFKSTRCKMVTASSNFFFNTVDFSCLFIYDSVLFNMLHDSYFQTSKFRYKYFWGGRVNFLNKLTYTKKFNCDFFPVNFFLLNCICKFAFFCSNSMISVYFSCSTKKMAAVLACTVLGYVSKKSEKGFWWVWIIKTFMRWLCPLLL